MTTTVDQAHVITDREIGAAELQVTLDQIEGRTTPQWVRDLANVRLTRAPLPIPARWPNRLHPARPDCRDWPTATAVRPVPAHVFVECDSRVLVWISFTATWAAPSHAGRCAGTSTRAALTTDPPDQSAAERKQAIQRVRSACRTGCAYEPQLRQGLDPAGRRATVSGDERTSTLPLRSRRPHTSPQSRPGAISR